jgi:hypothetical protein
VKLMWNSSNSGMAIGDNIGPKLRLGQPGGNEKI